MFITKVLAQSADEVIGKIKPTVGILTQDAIDASGKLTGVLVLFNSLLKIAFVAGGLWAFINFIIAGYTFLSAGGDPKNVVKAWDRIWQSFIGLIFIVGSFLGAAIVGILLFHDATAILQPTLGTK